MCQSRAHTLMPGGAHLSASSSPRPRDTLSFASSAPRVPGALARLGLAPPGVKLMLLGFDHRSLIGDRAARLCGICAGRTHRAAAVFLLRRAFPEIRDVRRGCLLDRLLGRRQRFLDVILVHYPVGPAESQTKGFQGSV